MIGAFFVLANAGEAIAGTDFFDSEPARNGFLYVTWNAGAMRLLIPDSVQSIIEEMRTGRRCVVSRGVMQGGPMHGQEMLEIMFDDGSDSPYVVTLSLHQVDRDVTTPACAMPVTAWTRKGKVAEWPGWYRVVATLPCLKEVGDAG